MTAKPYVSVVIVGRNDDYGDDFLGRINTFVRSLDHQVQNYPGVFELVVVEWNPLPSKDSLAKVLRPTKNLQTRIITVGADLHDTIGAQSPVLEFHGKNVGIRRAHGEFVLVTNPDILFTQELVDEIAQKRLRLDTVYRTDRYDFYNSGIRDVPDQDLVDFAVKNTFMVHGMDGDASVSMPIDDRYRYLPTLPRSRVDLDAFHTNASGDFLLAAKEVFFTVRGLYETLEHRWHIDSISLLRFKIAHVRQHIFVAPCCVFHQHHDRAPQDVAFQSLDVMGLAAQKGDTKWGFALENLPEIVLGVA